MMCGVLRAFSNILSQVLDRDLICCFEDGSYRASPEEVARRSLFATAPGRLRPSWRGRLPASD